MKSILLFVIFCNSCYANKNITPCGIDLKSQKLAEFIITSKNQLRKNLLCDQKLSNLASQKAKLLGHSNNFNHTIDKMSPNEFLRENNIQLPTSYEFRGNQVEIIDNKSISAENSYDYFSTNEITKQHLLGENVFFNAQDKIGVGYYYDEKNRKNIWVVLITSFRNENDSYVPPMKIKIMPVNFEKTKNNKLSKKEKRRKRRNDKNKRWIKNSYEAPKL